MSSRRGLALTSFSAIALAVSVAATYPRWHPVPPAHPAADPVAAPATALAQVAASTVLPELPALPGTQSALSWAKLTVNQRTALAPYALYWDHFSEVRKRKWLKIAAEYPKLSLDEQSRLHQRMTQWVEMTADQRRTARENFQLSKAVPQQQREKAWAAYQQLPEDQKKKLAAIGKNHRPTVVSTPLTGKKEVKDLNTVRRPESNRTPAASAAGAQAAARGTGLPTGGRNPVARAAVPAPAPVPQGARPTAPPAAQASAAPGGIHAAPPAPVAAPAPAAAVAPAEHYEQ